VSVNDVIAHMVFQDLHQQAIDRATTGRESLEDLCAVQFVVERPLDRLDLASDAPHSIDQLLVVTNGMRHGRYRIAVF
jgi:hypothetical protein